MCDLPSCRSNVDRWTFTIESSLLQKTFAQTVLDHDWVPVLITDLRPAPGPPNQSVVSATKSEVGASPRNGTTAGYLLSKYPSMSMIWLGRLYKMLVAEERLWHSVSSFTPLPLVYPHLLAWPTPT